MHRSHRKRILVALLLGSNFAAKKINALLGQLPSELQNEIEAATNLLSEGPGPRYLEY